MENYNNSGNPEFLNEYLVHIRVVRMLSERTVQEYYLDNRLFLKYIYNLHHDCGCTVDDTDISAMTADELQQITVSDVYNYIFYASDERHNNERARYRKLSSLHSFFKYLTKVAHLVREDVTKDIEIPAPRAGLPKFLSLGESLRLLEASGSSDSLRNYCIITIFLNCGVRLSELVGMNVRDIDFTERRMKVLGKGNKERMVYLNDACIDALKKYLELRSANEKAKAEPKVHFLGRLANYKYFDMDDTILEAMKLAKECSEKLKKAEENVNKILTETGREEDFKVEE